MKTPRFFYGALAVFCAAVLVIGTAGAAAMTQQGTAHNFKDKAGQSGLTKMLFCGRRQPGAEQRVGQQRILRRHRPLLLCRRQHGPGPNGCA